MMFSAVDGDIGDTDRFNSTEPELDFENVSDTEDPSYTPQREKQKEKNMRDFFRVNSEKLDRSQSKLQNASSRSTSFVNSSFGTTTSDASSSSVPTSSSNSSVKEIHQQERGNLMATAKKYPYLDGKFFKLVAINENEKKVDGQCQLCLPKCINIKGCLGVSTNFLKHLRKVHNSSVNEYNAYKQERKTELKRAHDSREDTYKNSTVTNAKKQRKITDVFCRDNKVFQSQKEFDKRIVNFIVSTMSPINVVDNPAFVALFDGSGLNIMHRTTAVKRIERMYLENVARVKSDLEKASFVCTTADVWSAKHRSFFGVTAHWINEGYERCSATLACRRFMGSHTYDKISEILEDIHLQFNLRNDKLVATVSDNGSNFVKAFKEFGPTTELVDRNEEDEEDEDIEFLDISNSNSILPKHIRCASHSLNLIATVDVKNAIQKNISLRTKHTNVIAKCSMLWKLAGKPKTSEIMKQVLGHTLSYPGATRWNSMYDSLSQILNSKELLEELFEKLNMKSQVLKDSELEYLTQYCTIMQPLADAIDILQGEHNTYYGYLLPCLGSIYKKLNRIELDTISIARPILEASRDGLLKRFSAYFNFSTPEAKDASIASFTLPRFKLRWKHCFQEFIEDEDLSEKITKFILEKVPELNLEHNLESPADQEEIKHSKLDNFFELDDIKENESSCGINNKKKIELEILQYLNDSSTENRSLSAYPYIKKQFYKYNTCLPSSAPVERLFSFAEIINSPRRNALSDKHFEELVMLKSNSKQYNILT